MMTTLLTLLTGQQHCAAALHCSTTDRHAPASLYAADEFPSRSYYTYTRTIHTPRRELDRLLLLLLSCAKSHMLSASRQQPHLLHVSAVDRRQTWSMDKS